MMTNETISTGTQIDDEKGNDDYKNWDKLIRRYGTMNLTASERKKVEQALRWLRKEFGERFLNDAFEANHPICRYITNSMPWARRWLIGFVETIRELKETMEQSRYDKLIKELKNPTRDKDFRNRSLFDERKSVLEIARKFSTLFDLSLDPEVEVTGKPKSPDLKLVEKSGGTEIYVEISATHESEEERDVGQIMAIIGKNLAGFHQVQYTGRLKEKLSREKHEEELEAINRIIGEAVKKVKKEREFQEILFENKIELGIAPNNDRESLEIWAVKRDLRTGGWYFDYKTDEISRIKQKIRKEQKQLPHDYPTILLIRNDMFFFHHDIKKAIEELSKGLHKYPSLWLLVIAGGFLAPGEEAICEEEELYVYIDGDKERYLILINPSYEREVPHCIRTKVLECFKQVTEST
jgi:hypothetical protein